MPETIIFFVYLVTKDLQAVVVPPQSVETTWLALILFARQVNIKTQRQMNLFLIQEGEKGKNSVRVRFACFCFKVKRKSLYLAPA